MSSPMLFDDFQPGQALGDHQEVFDQSLAASWRSLFGLAPGRSPHPGELPSLAVALAMRAYLSVVSPRPPGNVHARQQFQMLAMPEVDETIVTSVICVGKEYRRERRYVDIQVEGRGRDARPLFVGEMSLIWAA